MNTTRRPPSPPPEVLATIRAEIVRRRTAASLSQAALSEAAGLSPAAVGLIESGRTEVPGLGTLCAIADALGCGPADLIAPRQNKSRNS